MLVSAAACFTLIFSIAIAEKTPVNQETMIGNRVLTRKPFLKFQTMPKGSVLLSGEPLHLDCVTTGAPNAVIFWKKNGKTIREPYLAKRKEVELNDQKLVSETSIIHSILHIQCPTSGTYQCISSNGYDLIEANATVSIIGDSDEICFPSLAPRITQFDMFRLELNGNAVTLRCESSDQKATWTWRRDSKTLVSGGNVEVNKNELHIRNINWESEADYECEATNEFGSAAERTFLMPVTSNNNILV
ncbi:hypothetical protein CAEBREN_15961 [Caenorhabditis brenneri]|uniref:Ig-like domain-containing protein n=1 Tax=Caenorhabditis brenneri TaxID=135651 RepID=G0MWD7_CAEBE|nr:hypothetical protein CAEBREN_15961 [Caenorhabditis brenneri]